MANYLLWMMRYSEAMRHLLEKIVDTSDMSYEQMLQILERPDNLENNKELVGFLEELGLSNVSIEEKAVQLSENYYRFFEKIAA